MSSDHTGKGPGARWRPEVLAAVTELLAEVPGVTQKTMFGVPAFFVDGRLFCCIWGEGVGLRLPMDRAQTVVGADALGPFRPFGRAPMTGWVQRDVESPEAIADDQSLIEATCEHVRGL